MRFNENTIQSVWEIGVRVCSLYAALHCFFIRVKSWVDEFLISNK